ALGRPQAVGTIVDDDGAPALTIGDGAVLEGDSGTVNLTFPVYLSSASSQAVTVNYTTADNTATAGLDYTATANTLNIPAGQLSATVTVQVIGDQLAEGNETFFVNLSNAFGASIARATAVGTIVDDDA